MTSRPGPAHRRRWHDGSRLVGFALLAACLPNNPPEPQAPDPESTTSGAATGASSDEPDPNATSDDGFSCGTSPTCTFALVSQTLDDRVEVFRVRPGETPTFRFSVDLDLKENACSGCAPGDYGAGRLDEPYGLTLAGDDLLVLLGHFPDRDAGSLLSLPVARFEGVGPSSPLEGDAYFTPPDRFTGGATSIPLLVTEPVFVHLLELSPGSDPSQPDVSERLLVVGALQNRADLPASYWTESGTLLLLDPSDLAEPPVRVTLGRVASGECLGLGAPIHADGRTLAVPCGRPASLVFLDLPKTPLQLADDDPSFTARRCVLDPSGHTRIAALAPDGEGGVLALTSALDDQGSNRVWSVDSDCKIRDQLALPGPPSTRATALRRDGTSTRWFVALDDRVAALLRSKSDGLELCDPVASLAAHVTGPPTRSVLAVAPHGEGVFVGLGDRTPGIASPGFGQVLWVDLREGASQGNEPPACASAAPVFDLTDGGSRHAPKARSSDVATWRRAPAVLELAVRSSTTGP